MRITFSVPASTRPTGGPILMYSLANALCARGHEITLLHNTLFCGTANETLAASYPSSPDEIGYIDFVDGIDHVFVPDPLADPSVVPDGDVIIKGEEVFPARCGQPVILVQGVGVFMDRFERSLIESDGPKVCVSQWLADHVIDEYGIDPSEVLRLPVGIDPDIFSLTADEADRDVDVCMAYNEWPTKGAEAGIAALTEVKAAHPDLSVVLFGTYPMGHLMPPWMTYVENLPPQRLAAEIFDRARVMLNPSRIEGFGLTSVEAMACGCALVTAANGGSDEFAFDERTALVVDGNDVAAMAAAVSRLVDDTDLRARVAAGGVATAATFRWSRSAAVLEEFLRARVAAPT